MTDTPETDAARITEKNGCIAIFCGRQVVPVEFARCLERARDWARKQWRLESARVSASIMAIESLERDRAEAQLLVKTLSDQCDMIEEDKEYNAQLANQFKSERDRLREINAELLESLKWIAETPDAWLERDAPDGATVYEWRYSRHFLDIAREAIAKANGEQP